MKKMKKNKSINKINIKTLNKIKKAIANSLYDAIKVNENKEWAVYELPCKEETYKGVSTYDAFVWLCDGTKWQDSAYNQFKSMGKTLYIFVNKTAGKDSPIRKIGTDENEEVYVDANEHQVKDVDTLNLPSLRKTAEPVDDEKCTCDIYELMRNGKCKCGAVQKLKEKGRFHYEDLKKTQSKLISHGIKIIKGNFIKKRDIDKVLRIIMDMT